jgi:hypothetical protein
MTSLIKEYIIIVKLEKLINGRSLIEQAIYEGDKLYENRLKKTNNIISDLEIITINEKNMFN